MEAQPLNWLLNSRLADSVWLTDRVKEEMANHLKSAKQMEGQEIIDREIQRWAELANDAKALEDPNLLPRLGKAFAAIMPSRFGDWIIPLAIDNSFVHVPPATMVPHSRRSVVPHIARLFHEDETGLRHEGRLILIDPLNHVFLAPMCCALLITACYDLDQNQFAKLFDFIVASALYYTGSREKTEILLNSKMWNDDAEKLIHVDKGIGPRSEKMAFNILAFAFYHEVSHSILGHFGDAPLANIQISGFSQNIGVFTAEQQEEIEADVQGLRYFETLISTCPNSDMKWTGEDYDHAPLIFFRILSFLEIVKSRFNRQAPVTSSHPSPMDRFEILNKRLLSRSTGGALTYDRIVSALDKVTKIVESMDTEDYLTKSSLLSRS